MQRAAVPCPDTGPGDQITRYMGVAGAVEASLQERARLKHTAPTLVQVATSARSAAQQMRALLAAAGLATRARRGLQVLRLAQTQSARRA